MCMFRALGIRSIRVDLGSNTNLENGVMSSLILTYKKRIEPQANDRLLSSITFIMGFNNQ
jgi:hypothetical protein